MPYQDSDKTTLDRIAQPLVVEARRCSAAGVASQWQPVWHALVDMIQINHGAKYNTAIISFPALRWQETYGLYWGDMIRIRTDQPYRANGEPYNGGLRTILFQGFIVSYHSGFSGGDASGGAYEENAVVCYDYRWLLNTTSAVWGQYARSPDDYLDYGTQNQAAKNTCTFMTGRRTIFNADGRPNRDPVDFVFTADSGYPGAASMPIFAPRKDALPWTAREILRYIFSPLYNRVYNILPIVTPAAFTGISGADWDRVINHVIIEGGGVIDAAMVVCKHLGWSLREDYTESYPLFVFYRPTAAAGYQRSAGNPVILQSLHAPAVGEKITVPVSQGRRLLWAAEIIEDISAVINNPLGLGAPDKFEITVDLVPGWKDSDLTPDSGSSYANLFKTEAQIQADTDPNQWSVFNKYHTRGAGFLRDVGRKWVLNETGLYSTALYDRGMPFDFATVIPAKYIKDGATGRRFFGPFNRVFEPCLTFDKDSLNSVGIRVEFSFDGGASWQTIPCTIENLPGECGIRIIDPNLAEMLDIAKGTINSGPLSGVELNYWTSLADDKVNLRSFKNGNWRTRIRITASVRLDQRIRFASVSLAASGSPFRHMSVYDFSDKYTRQVRTPSSILGSLPAWQTDESDKLIAHIDAIRVANEDLSINGRFTLDRLWLGDGSGCPDFAIGDGIEGITGRRHHLSAAVNGTNIYPEIIQITYDVQRQKQHIITRDLRLAEMV